jgi:hypothetical protein
VGVATASPVSTLDVSGSAGVAIAIISGNTTLDATHHTVIINGGTPSITLPGAAASNTRRIYIIVNHTGTARTISTYRDFSNNNVTTVPATGSITLQSDGSNWYRIQ